MIADVVTLVRGAVIAVEGHEVDAVDRVERMQAPVVIYAHAIREAEVFRPAVGVGSGHMAIGVVSAGLRMVRVSQPGDLEIGVVIGFEAACAAVQVAAMQAASAEPERPALKTRPARMAIRGWV